MSTNFCADALEEVIGKFSPRDIFNTDHHGSQFTSEDWATSLKHAALATSMDSKGAQD